MNACIPPTAVSNPASLPLVIQPRSARPAVSRAFLPTFIGSLLCLLGATAPTLRAQNATFIPLQRVLVSGLSHPDAVVADQAGNLYVADTLHNTVLKVTLSNGIATQHVVASGLGGPAGIAVDSSGDVYVVETITNDVLKETLSGGTYTASTVATGLVHPFGVALDSGNNVYVTVSTGVWKYPAGGGTHSVLAGGLTDPQGVAVDTNGYIFVADYTNNRVLQISGSLVAPIVTGLNGPRDVVLDLFNNLYIAESGSGSIVKESYKSYKAYSQSTVATGFSNDYGVAADSMGNVFVADTGNNQVLGLQTAAVDFGALNVGMSRIQTLTFKFIYAASSSAGDVVVSTEGIAGKDFQETGTGTCDAAANYNPGDTCTVNVKFLPTVPGLRAGSALLLDSSGNIIATAFLHGMGNSPQVVFNPGTVSTIMTGFEGQPQSSGGLAVDPAGNLFVTVNSAVNKVPAGGGSPTSLPLNSSVGSIAVLNGSGDVIQVEQLQFQSHGGNVYYDEQIGEVRWNGGGYNSGYFFNTTTSDPNAPTLYTDSRGNFYQVNADGILEFPQTGDFTNDPVFVNALPADIINSSSDGKGNLYALLPSGSVQKSDRTHPPSLVFASTNVGSTSSDSPKSFTTTNIGNASLILPTPAMGVNPSISSNFALDSSTTCPQIGSATPPASLSAGASCNYAVKFVPSIAGVIMGSLVLTDTNLNAMYATQTSALSGMGLANGQFVFSPSSVAFGNVKVGTVSGPVSVTVTNGTSSAVTYLSSSGLSKFRLQSGTCGALSSNTTVAPGASCTFMVSFAPVTVGSSNASLTMSSSNGPVTFQLSGNGV